MVTLPTLKRGNTYRFTYTHLHNGVAADLTGCKVIFTVKENEGDDDLTDSSAVIQKIVISHLPQSGDTLGKTVINCTPTDTLVKKDGVTVIPGDTYFFDIKVIHADGTAFTEEEGKVKIDIAPTNLVS